MATERLINAQQEPTMANETTKTGADSPFSQAFGQAKSAAEDFTRIFSELKFPAVPDLELLLNAHKRNLETLSAANRVALEGAQAVAKRHMEILQQTVSELSETVRSFTNAGEPPQAKAAKQTELLKRSYERAVANTRELSDLISRSNTEALELLNRRVSEALDEVKTLVEKAGIKAG
ncbi:phasin family protein [Rhodovastum atsumiense]